jgi:outer membrane protein
LIKLLFLFISASLIFLSGSAFSQDSSYKIGFVNTSRVLKESPQAREVEGQLKSEFGPRETQLKDKRSEILALEEQIKSDELADSANNRRKLERKIRLKVSQLKFLEQEFREDQNLRRNEGVRELQKVISKVLENLGDSGEFDLILTEGVSYVSDQIDITDQIIEMLKKQYNSSETIQ